MKMRDIAEEMEVVGPELPEIVTLEEFAAAPPAVPSELIEGILHRGCKMVLGGTSKSNKSWCLLDLAISVASGQKWWGRQCARHRVVYVNFELQPWAVYQRLEALCGARRECSDIGTWLSLWNLRGYNTDLTMLRPKLEERLTSGEYGLVIVDPAYKLLGARDENLNGDIANLMSEFERLAQRCGAAIVVAHHFAKGDSSGKDAIDRMSGAGAWARDPDSIMVMTPHEEEDCYTVTGILRNLPRLPEFVVAWDYPVMKVDPKLNPEALRRQGGKSKACTDREFVVRYLSEEARARSVIVRMAEKDGIGARTVDRTLSRLKDQGLIGSGGGLYWVTKEAA